MKNKNIPGRAFAYILHQIYNERRSNTALLVELLIVSSIVWYLVDCTYTMVAKATEPMGLDYHECYILQIGRIGDKSPAYDMAHPDSAGINAADRLALIDRIRHDEDIEAAAYSDRCEPFSGAYNGNMIRYDSIKTGVRFIVCQPDFLRVFRYQSITGKTPDELAAMLKDRRFLISDEAMGDSINLKQLVGKEFMCGFDTILMRLADVILPPKRFAYEEQAATKVIVKQLEDGDLDVSDMFQSIAVRVKPGHDDGFKERFGEKIKGKMMRAGNFYISDVTSCESMKATGESEENQQLRFYTAALTFLMMNVFLGLLGTFWFRTQHRYPEIGLQKAFGATNRDVIMRLMSEAGILMSIAFAVSMIINLNIAYAELTELYRNAHITAVRFAVTEAVSYVLMLLIIGLGIWIPARKATEADPAKVLKGE